MEEGGDTGGRQLISCADAVRALRCSLTPCSHSPAKFCDRVRVMPSRGDACSLVDTFIYKSSKN